MALPVEDGRRFRDDWRRMMEGSVWFWCTEQLRWQGVELS